MFAVSAMRRRRRRILAECRTREAVYKERTLELLSQGVETDDPEFIEVFTSARNAHSDYKAQLRSNMRLEATDRKTKIIQRHIDEQLDRRLILDINRKLLNPKLQLQLDQTEEAILEKEDILAQTIDDITLNDSITNTDELDEESEALLTKWILNQKTKKRPTVAKTAIAPTAHGLQTKVSRNVFITGKDDLVQPTDLGQPSTHEVITCTSRERIIHPDGIHTEIYTTEDVSPTILDDVSNSCV
ncbi:UL14 [Gallid alphaherpesvirus 2]|uniref:UL14 n=1 Tax=Gallid alphaherpesvirus 2 TaxID=10390 RepID=H6WUU5_9ALPH|nr:UL14 [Gallid alphaherpesvirus 2]